MKRISILILQLTFLSIAILGFVFHTYQANAKINASIIVEYEGDNPSTDENGAIFPFSIKLDSQPTKKVTILITSDDSTEGIVAPDPIEFNQGNWKNPKLVEVTGVADGIEDGDVLYHIHGSASSVDNNFNDIEMPAITVINLNDPVPIANDDRPPIDGYARIIIPVLENDTALADIPIEITVVSDPVFGTYTINPDPDNTITYTPSETTFLGLDQFSYMICDFDGDCASADVIIEDQIPPEIISVSPVGVGEIFEVSDEEITIEVEVADNFLVNCVNFIRWDDRIEQYIQLGDVCQPPFSITLQGSTLNYGWNQVYFQASDIAGNLSPHAFIWLYRLNYNYIPLVITP